MKYRVKINTKNNGDQEYSPQVKIGFFYSWDNLIEFSNLNYVDISETTSMLYDSVEDAKSLINRHMEQIKSENQKKTKKTKYLYL